MKKLIAVSALVLIAACASKFDYIRPGDTRTTSNSVEIPKSREAVWAAAIPAIGKRFFVINNLDQSSGFINLSYGGNPEKYIDCGTISSYVTSLKGERTYTFPGSRASVSYEYMSRVMGSIEVDRTMSLEGRVNLIFESLGSSRTRVSANTRYLLRRDEIPRVDYGKMPRQQSDSISLNTGQLVSFPPSLPGGEIECIPTGALEMELLNLVSSAIK